MLEPLPIACSKDDSIGLLPGLANRHGLITGATGTGKTVTLQVLARHWFSQDDDPVVAAWAGGAGLECLSGNILGYLRQVRPSGARDHL